MRGLTGWGVRILIIAAIAGGAFIFRDRLSGGAGELAVGDCFDVPVEQTEVEDVQHHPCNEAHDAEVVFVGNHPAPDGAPAPTEAELFDFIASTCFPAFNIYTGTDLLTAGVHDMGAFFPLEGDWASGDRQITCYAYLLTRGKMTTTIKAG